MKIAVRLLLLSSLLIAIGIVAASLLLRRPEPVLTAFFETAGGLTIGQMVAMENGETAGTIRAIDPCAGGVIVTVALRRSPRLNQGTILLLRPAPTPVPPRLEIIPAENGEPLAWPAKVPGRIEIGPPDGLAEPSPLWPGGTES